MPIFGTGGSSTGKLFRAYWFEDGSAVAHPIGNIRGVTVETGGTITREEDSGNRTPFLKQGSVAPSLRMTFDVVRTNYITQNCIITANGNLPLHRILWTDGQAWFDMSGLADSCRLRTSPGDMLQAEVTFKGRRILDSVADTCSGWAEDPLTHVDVTSFTIGNAGGSGWTNWERLEWGCDNQVDQVSLGREILPSEVYEKAARHTGSYRVTRRWGPTKIDESQVGLGQDIEIVVTDKQTPPVPTTFTYASGVVRNVSVEDRDLDLIWESGDWEAENVAIV